MSAVPCCRVWAVTAAMAPLLGTRAVPSAPGPAQWEWTPQECPAIAAVSEPPEQGGTAPEKFQPKGISPSRRCPWRDRGEDRDRSVAQPWPCPRRLAPNWALPAPRTVPSAALTADGGAGRNANTGLYKRKSVLYKPILSANHLYLEHLFLLETLKPYYIRACLNPLA